ncbi:trypco2 family protein [Streptomyces sp. Ag109_G2-15]|uniref:trypco2 family protein n=1 Tax=Streptomyces sp. Ag109_G2-15 TaxID=1938850 RepID=UPI00211CB2D1|nr:trypco2 family protein [Streptomyces sp. Ag109_G2-15]
MADAVTAVREELTRAAAQGAGQDWQFSVGPVQMEFEVELRADARAKGGFRVWAVTADAEAGVARARTHRISFTLTPRRADGTEVRIAEAASDAFGPGDVSETVE